MKSFRLLLEGGAPPVIDQRPLTVLPFSSLPFFSPLYGHHGALSNLALSELSLFCVSSASSADTMTETSTFHLFPELPPELRLMIWRECLPRRVHQLDNLFEDVVFDLPRGDVSPCNLFATTYMNGRPPVITRVCRESRVVALESSGSEDYWGDIPLEARWYSDTTVDGWLDPARDSVHLNWIPRYYPEYDGYGSPLHALAWEAARVRGGGSFMIGYLKPMTRESVPIEIIRQQPKWMVVMRVIVVHATPEAGAKTGLFGLLGDARVQLVDVSDEARMNAYFDLAEEWEHKGRVHTSQDLHRVSADSMEKELRNSIVETYKSEESESLPALPIMRPVIMFRFCSDMCNHEGYTTRTVPDRIRKRLYPGRGRGRGRGRGMATSHRGRAL